jgi:hypothetical protein
LTFVVGQIVGHRGLKYMVVQSTDSDTALVATSFAVCTATT